jgi:hypothetical protein
VRRLWYSNGRIIIDHYGRVVGTVKIGGVVAKAERPWFRPGTVRDCRPVGFS